MGTRITPRLDLQRRTDDLGQYFIDFVQPNFIIEGRVEKQANRIATADPLWQIKAITLEGTERKTQYYDDGKYRGAWDQRLTYFTAPTDNGEILEEYAALFGLTKDGSNNVCTRVCGELSVTPARPVSVRYASVAINSATWTDLTVGFTNLIQLSVRNENTVLCRVNGDNTPPGFTGMPLPSEDERNYNDVASTFKLYAKCESGSVNLDVEGMQLA